MSTWMVVEDEPGIYEVLLAMFEIWGIAGVAFIDGSEAMAWIDDVDAGRVQDDQLPELALLDIRLPEISGPEIAARLRQSPKLGNIAIVLITAFRLKPFEEEEVIEKAQADLLMYKPPPPPAEFKEILERALAMRAANTPEDTESAELEEDAADEEHIFEIEDDLEDDESGEVEAVVVAIDEEEPVEIFEEEPVNEQQSEGSEPDHDEEDQDELLRDH